MQTHKQRRAGTMCLPGGKEYLWSYSTQYAYALEEAWDCKVRLWQFPQGEDQRDGWTAWEA